MKRKRTTVSQFRRKVRDNLHLQLNAMLQGPSTMPNGEKGTVLDDIVARSLVGYGFSVSISVRHPDEEGRAVEDPSLTEQPPPLVILP